MFTVFSRQLFCAPWFHKIFLYIFWLLFTFGVLTQNSQLSMDVKFASVWFEFLPVSHKNWCKFSIDYLQTAVLRPALLSFIALDQSLIKEFSGFLLKRKRLIPIHKENNRKVLNFSGSKIVLIFLSFKNNTLL